LRNDNLIIFISKDKKKRNNPQVSGGKEPGHTVGKEHGPTQEDFTTHVLYPAM